MRREVLVVPFLLAAALAGCAAAPARHRDREAMEYMAEERGCTTCHRAAPAASSSDPIRPPAPSWREIATKYRGRASVEKELAQTVVGGTDPEARHWKNRAAFAGMLPNEVALNPDEARALVRWILRSH